MIEFTDYQRTDTVGASIHSAVMVMPAGYQEARNWVLVATPEGSEIVVSPYGDKHIDVSNWSLNDSGPNAVLVPYQLQLDSFLMFVLDKIEQSL